MEISNPASALRGLIPPSVFARCSYRVLVARSQSWACCDACGLGSRSERSHLAGLRYRASVLCASGADSGSARHRRSSPATLVPGAKAAGGASGAALSEVVASVSFDGGRFAYLACFALVLIRRDCSLVPLMVSRLSRGADRAPLHVRGYHFLCCLSLARSLRGVPTTGAPSGARRPESPVCPLCGAGASEHL